MSARAGDLILFRCLPLLPAPSGAEHRRHAEDRRRGQGAARPSPSRARCTRPRHRRTDRAGGRAVPRSGRVWLTRTARSGQGRVMAEPARALPMVVADFVRWDDGSDTRYELAFGVPMAMAPPSGRHADIVANITSRLSRQLDRPCRAPVGAGVARHDDDDEFRLPDVMVSCEPVPGVYFRQPCLIVEVLSPSTEKADRTDKLDFYRSLASVEAVVLVWQDQRRVQVIRRSPSAGRSRTSSVAVTSRLPCSTSTSPSTRFTTASTFHSRASHLHPDFAGKRSLVSVRLILGEPGNLPQPATENLASKTSTSIHSMGSRQDVEQYETS